LDGTARADSTQGSGLIPNKQKVDYHLTARNISTFTGQVSVVGFSFSHQWQMCRDFKYFG
jgi:hypothetical protein